MLNQYSWLNEFKNVKSVTELEILYGVLNNPEMAGRAFFYFRSKEYARIEGEDFLAVSDEASHKQNILKDKIRKSKFPVLENYPNPETFAKYIYNDLWKILDEIYPLVDTPDEFERTNNQHQSYAIPRQRLFIDGGNYLTTINKKIENNKNCILIKGHSGTGKSALIAN